MNPEYEILSDSAVPGQAVDLDGLVAGPRALTIHDDLTQLSDAMLRHYRRPLTTQLHQSDEDLKRQSMSHEKQLSGGVSNERLVELAMKARIELECRRRHLNSSSGVCSSHLVSTRKVQHQQSKVWLETVAPSTLESAAAAAGQMAPSGSQQPSAGSGSQASQGQCIKCFTAGCSYPLSSLRELPAKFYDLPRGAQHLVCRLHWTEITKQPWPPESASKPQLSINLTTKRLGSLKSNPMQPPKLLHSASEKPPQQQLRQRQRDQELHHHASEQQQLKQQQANVVAGQVHGQALPHNAVHAATAHAAQRQVRALTEEQLLGQQHRARPLRRQPPPALPAPTPTVKAKPVYCKPTKRQEGESRDAAISIDDDDDGAEAAPPAPAAVTATALPFENGPAGGTRRSTRPATAATYREELNDAKRFKGLRCFYPAGGAKHSVEVTAEDFNRLEQLEFLNDTVIDFYIRWIEVHLPPDVRESCYFFNSFFYKKLTEKQPAKGGRAGAVAAEAGGAPPMDKWGLNHARVSKWTKDVDIFSKRYVFVPVHEALHWTLAILCNPGLPIGGDSVCPFILHLDSMPDGHETPPVVSALKHYMAHEWKRLADSRPDSVPGQAAARPDYKSPSFEVGRNMPFKRLTLPQQRNHCDCGLFLLAYMEWFTYAAPKRLPFKFAGDVCGKHSPRFCQADWFEADNASMLRDHIKALIYKCMAEQLEEPCPQILPGQSCATAVEGSTAVAALQNGGTAGGEDATGTSAAVGTVAGPNRTQDAGGVVRYKDVRGAELWRRWLEHDEQEYSFRVRYMPPKEYRIWAMMHEGKVLTRKQAETVAKKQRIAEKRAKTQQEERDRELAEQMHWEQQYGASGTIQPAAAAEMVAPSAPKRGRVEDRSEGLTSEDDDMFESDTSKRRRQSSGVNAPAAAAATTIGMRSSQRLTSKKATANPSAVDVQHTLETSKAVAAAAVGSAPSALKQVCNLADDASRDCAVNDTAAVPGSPCDPEGLPLCLQPASLAFPYHQSTVSKQQHETAAGRDQAPGSTGKKFGRRYTKRPGSCADGQGAMAVLAAYSDDDGNPNPAAPSIPSAGAAADVLGQPTPVAGAAAVPQAAAPTTAAIASSHAVQHSGHKAQRGTLQASPASVLAAAAASSIARGAPPATATLSPPPPRSPQQQTDPVAQRLFACVEDDEDEDIAGAQQVNECHCDSKVAGPEHCGDADQVDSTAQPAGQHGCLNSAGTCTPATSPQKKRKKKQDGCNGRQQHQQGQRQAPVYRAPPKAADCQPHERHGRKDRLQQQQLSTYHDQGVQQCPTKHGSSGSRDADAGSKQPALPHNHIWFDSSDNEEEEGGQDGSGNRCGHAEDEQRCASADEEGRQQHVAGDHHKDEELGSQQLFQHPTGVCVFPDDGLQTSAAPVDSGGQPPSSADAGAISSQQANNASADDICCSSGGFEGNVPDACDDSQQQVASKGAADCSADEALPGDSANGCVHGWDQVPASTESPAGDAGIGSDVPPKPLGGQGWHAAPAGSRLEEELDCAPSTLRMAPADAHPAGGCMTGGAAAEVFAAEQGRWGAGPHHRQMALEEGVEAMHLGAPADGMSTGSGNASSGDEASSDADLIVIRPLPAEGPAAALAGACTGANGSNLEDSDGGSGGRATYDMDIDGYEELPAPQGDAADHVQLVPLLPRQSPHQQQSARPSRSQGQEASAQHCALTGKAEPAEPASPQARAAGVEAQTAVPGMRHLEPTPLPELYSARVPFSPPPKVDLPLLPNLPMGRSLLAVPPPEPPQASRRLYKSKNRAAISTLRAVAPHLQEVLEEHQQTVGAFRALRAQPHGPTHVMGAFRRASCAQQAREPFLEGDLVDLLPLPPPAGVGRRPLEVGFAAELSRTVAGLRSAAVGSTKAAQLSGQEVATNAADRFRAPAAPTQAQEQPLDRQQGLALPPPLRSPAEASAACAVHSTAQAEALVAAGFMAAPAGRAVCATVDLTLSDDEADSPSDECRELAGRAAGSDIRDDGGDVIAPAGATGAAGGSTPQCQDLPPQGASLRDGPQLLGRLRHLGSPADLPGIVYHSHPRPPPPRIMSPGTLEPFLVPCGRVSHAATSWSPAPAGPSEMCTKPNGYQSSCRFLPHRLDRPAHSAQPQRDNVLTREAGVVSASISQIAAGHPAGATGPPPTGEQAQQQPAAGHACPPGCLGAAVHSLEAKKQKTKGGHKSRLQLREGKQNSKKLAAHS